MRKKLGTEVKKITKNLAPTFVKKIKQNQQSIHAIAKELNLKPDSIQNILDKAEKYNVNNTLLNNH